MCQRDTSACFFMLFRMSKWFHAAGRNYDKFQNKNASNAQKTKIFIKKRRKETSKQSKKQDKKVKIYYQTGKGVIMVQDPYSPGRCMFHIIEPPAKDRPMPKDIPKYHKQQRNVAPRGDIPINRFISH